MKKLIVAVGISALLMGTTVLADAPAEKTNNAAIVLMGVDHPYGCTMYIGGLTLTTDDAIHTVSTSSGNTKLVCHFIASEEAELPVKTVKLAPDTACGIYLPDSVVYGKAKGLLTPSGEAKLVCSYKAPKED